MQATLRSRTKGDQELARWELPRGTACPVDLEREQFVCLEQSQAAAGREVIDREQKRNCLGQ